MKLTNRNKNIVHDPEIEATINDTTPIEEITPAKEDIANDIIELPEESEPKPLAPEPEETTEPLEVKEEKEEKPKKPEQDYKERYVNSSKEAIVLYSKNKKLTDTINEAANLAEPTEDELRVYAKTQGAEYDELEDFSKNILKKTFISEKRFEKINEAAQESKNLDLWVEKVDRFTEAEETLVRYPAIADREEEFRAYCLDRTKPQRRSADLDDLVAAFLFNAEKVQPKKNKGSLLLAGGNGNAAPEKPKGTTEEDLIALRRSGEKGQKEYRRLLKEKKVTFEI